MNDNFNGMSRLNRPILLLSFAAFASAAAIRICDPMLPQIAVSFGTTTGQAANTITSFAIAYGLFQLVYGPLGDRYDKYKLIVWATLACIVGNVSAAVSSSLGWLVFSRAVAGTAAAGIIPMSMAWIGDSVPYERRQAILARYMSGSIFGLIGGQILGGFVADLINWRWSFVILSVVYLVVGLLLYYETRRKDSACCRAVSATAFSAGKSYAGQFLAVFQIRWAKVILITVFIESMATFGSLAFIPSYLHNHFGISLTAAGALIAMFGLGGLFYTSIAGRLVARFGERGLSMMGGPLLGAAFVMLLPEQGWAWAGLSSMLAGFGFYLLHNTLQTNATQMSQESRGTAVAMFVVAFFLGQSAGVTIGSMVIDSASPLWLFGSSACILPFVGLGFGYALRFRDA
jgi:predicted MFS family arabinose efflux permease